MMITFVRWTKKYLNQELAKTMVGTIIGYLTLVVFLCVISICPSCYSMLTRWANQENLPTIEKCSIEPLKEIENKYKWYNVRITLNSSYTSFSRLAFYIEPDENSDIFINRKLKPGVLLSGEKESHLFLKNFKKNTKEISFTALTTKDNVILEQYIDKPIAADECPFDLYVYGTKQ